MQVQTPTPPGKHVVPESPDYDVGKYIPELHGYILLHNIRFEWNVWLLNEQKIRREKWHEDWYNIGDLLRSLGFKDAHDQKEFIF